MVNHPGVLCELDSDRETGRGYYVGACFHVYATNVAGTEFELIDGGFTVIGAESPVLSKAGMKAPTLFGAWVEWDAVQFLATFAAAQTGWPHCLR